MLDYRSRWRGSEHRHKSYMYSLVQASINFRISPTPHIHLPQRLTRSLPGAQRSAVLSSFIDNDLLGCLRDANTDYQSSIVDLMQKPDPLLREQLARFFNSISSLASGRSYLSQAPPIVKALLQLMYTEKEDNDTRKNALGAVQKLSLRRSFARMMIKNDIVQWIVDNLLTQQDTLSDYTLRYSLALLMNISLRSIGQWTIWSTKSATQCNVQ